jgi:hypothetical protein
MEKQLLKPDEKLFSDIYIYDSEVVKRIETLIEGPECKQLIEKARKSGFALSLLDEVLPDRKIPAIPRVLSKLRPFYNRAEYQSKENYLQYLKQVYGFLQTPMEVPPGRFLNFFYPDLKKSWSPDHDIAQELLAKFYVEVKLISELSPNQWNEVREAENPEMVINKLIFKTEFKTDFKEFLRTIPWIKSHDAYGSPGLDLMYRQAPGSELPKKPFGVGKGYLKKLAQASLENRAHTLLWVDGEKIKLTNEGQITSETANGGEVHLDSFLGLSKVERDFVIHKHIIIWENPGNKKYKDTPFFKRLLYLKPHDYLCIIREEALPLEIAFLKHK